MFLHLFEFFLKFSVLFGVDYLLCIDLCKSLSLYVVVDLLENLFMIVLLPVLLEMNWFRVGVFDGWILGKNVESLVLKVLRYGDLIYYLSLSCINNINR